MVAVSARVTRGSAMPHGSRVGVGTRRNIPGFVMVRQTQAAIESMLALTKAESPAVQKLARDYAASCRVPAGASHQDHLNLTKRLLQEPRPYQTAT